MKKQIKSLIKKLFPHNHKWQRRGVNQYGITTYRMCLRCRNTESLVNESNEPEKFIPCEPVLELDNQFDENDEYIL